MIKMNLLRNVLSLEGPIFTNAGEKGDHGCLPLILFDASSKLMHFTKSKQIGEE